MYYPLRVDKTDPISSDMYAFGLILTGMFADPRKKSGEKFREHLNNKCLDFNHFITITRNDMLSAYKHRNITTFIKNVFDDAVRQWPHIRDEIIEMRELILELINYNPSMRPVLHDTEEDLGVKSRLKELTKTIDSKLTSKNAFIKKFTIEAAKKHELSSSNEIISLIRINDMLVVMTKEIEGHIKKNNEFGTEENKELNIFNNITQKNATYSQLQKVKKDINMRLSEKNDEELFDLFINALKETLPTKDTTELKKIILKIDMILSNNDVINLARINNIQMCLYKEIGNQRTVRNICTQPQNIKKEIRKRLDEKNQEELSRDYIDAFNTDSHKL